ncbi:aldehyde dehydrogenase (NADP(+)) [Amycolatopsis ultiminotia]|uniref:Aldehyde dehydrogenase (NADP(+)) n=1 Tax=Amycolatopsis ultiminotia TaxID=543629 RepID=A0ABP6YHA1_9PSEU
MTNPTSSTPSPPTGRALIGGTAAVPATAATFRAVDPATGEEIGPVFVECGAVETERAAKLAAAAFDGYRHTGIEERAAFLESIANEIEARASPIAELARLETGLPTARVAGETTRTTGQLRLFARTLREGDWLQARIDPGDPERIPLPRPDVRCRAVPLGPVAVFGASNFPLAFSVAGGDTASALAAGAPVIVKAHPSHPGTSELVGTAICEAVRRHGLPEGTFSLLQGTSHELGAALVTHPAIKAVGFTGSRAGGLALLRLAQQRPVPIPVYAEMSAVNPVFVLPGAVAERGAEIGASYVASVTGSAGQLCTKPGLLFVLERTGAQDLVDAAAAAIERVPATVLLNPAISTAFGKETAAVEHTEGVRLVATGVADPALACTGVPSLFETTGAGLLGRPRLPAEMFGPASVIVRVADEKELHAIAETLEGQLTATIHASAVDHRTAAALLGRLELIAGRVLFNDWPTGVEVNHAMVHGGPFPATSAPATTSVGTRAIERFLRPVAYQGVPVELLPAELRDDNPSHLFRRVDGVPEEVPAR